MACTHHFHSGLHLVFGQVEQGQLLANALNGQVQFQIIVNLPKRFIKMIIDCHALPFSIISFFILYPAFIYIFSLDAISRGFN